MTERQLVKSLADGDMAAWRWIDLTVRPWLLRLALEKCGRQAMGEEAAALVVTWLWENRASFAPRSARAVLRTRVRLMVHSLMRSRDRRHTNNAAWLRDDPRIVETPSVVVETNELMDRLEAAVATLPARQRRAFILVKLEGRTYAETAEVMGLASKTVENYVRTAVSAPAIQAFRMLLRGAGDDRGETH